MICAASSPEKNAIHSPMNYPVPRPHFHSMPAIPYDIVNAVIMGERIAGRAMLSGRRGRPS